MEEQWFADCVDHCGGHHETADKAVKFIQSDDVKMVSDFGFYSSVHPLRFLIPIEIDCKVI